MNVGSIEYHRDPNAVVFEDTEAIAEIQPDQDSCGVLLVKIDDKPVWFPKSQIHPDSEVYKKFDKGTLIVSRWIAENKGLL